MKRKPFLNKNKKVNKFFYSAILLPMILLSIILTGCPVEEQSLSDSDSSVSIVENRNSFVDLDFSINDYTITTVEEGGEIYSDINFDGKVRLNEKGYASLPFLHAAIQLPPSGEVEYKIVEQEYIDIQLEHPFLPSKGTIYRNQNPADIARSISPDSITEELYPSDLIKLTEPYIFRDVRGINVYAHSFRYDSQNQILRVYTKLRVSINVNNTIEGRNSMESVPSTIVNEMKPIYKSIFINYGELNKDSEIRRSFSNEIAEYGEILVIYTSRDASAINPYIEWKTQMGYKVHKKEVSKGTNAKSTIQNEYNSNNKLLYVQLVGDWEDIKSDKGTSQNKPMDPMLGCVKGSDVYPDIIIGRFSAENTTHVTTQVNKTIKYEKNPDTSGTWYKAALGLGSAEGPGDDNEIDFAHIKNIVNGRLMKTTYTKPYLYTDGDTSNKVSTALNSGVGTISYCGHGSPTSWGTTGFNNSGINSLSNGDKLPFIFSVACVNGEFSGQTCFAETWLRKTNGGAVATVMATINQPWEPPMRGEDYMNDLVIGGYNYSSNPGSGTSTSEGRTTFGSVVFNGLVLMYAENNGKDDKETIQTWTIFGDASLQIRTDTPKAISMSNSSVAAGSFATKITSGSSSIKGARVALSQGDNVYSAVTNSNGDVSINHGFTSGTVTIVVTGFNLATIVKTATISGGTTNQPPKASFNFSTSSLVVQFTDTSTDPENKISSRNWNFGDGKTSTSTNPSHNYSSAGTYSVKLTVTDQGGLSNTTTKSVTVSTTQSGYTLNVVDGTGDGQYNSGQTVSIKATVPEGKTFDKWVINSGSPNIADTNSENTTLIMPSKNVKITATFKGGMPDIGCGSLFDF